MLQSAKQYVLLLLFLLLCSSCNDGKKKIAEKGILDLTSWDFNESGIVTLNGEWEFYWKELLEPEDFEKKVDKSFIELPGVWNGFKHEDEEISGEGYATYRLSIKNDFENTKLGLRIPYHFTAYKLWINEKLVAQNGIVSKNINESKAQTLPTYIYFDGADSDIVVILQISNYAFDKAGAPASYRFGSEDQIKKLRSRQVALDLILAGILFIMAFHHLGLYYLMKKEIYTLYFSLVCFLVMLRTIGLGESFIIELFPDFDFEAYTKLIFVGFFIAPPLFLMFIHKLYPNDSKQIIVRIFMLIGLVFGASLIFPAKIYTSLVEPYFLVLLFLYSYLLSILIRACIKKRVGAFVALFGTVLMIIAVMNDILFELQIINTGYYSSYGLVVFIFSQSFLLSIKFTNAFDSIKNLSSSIKKINIANSRFVPTEFLSFLGKESIVDVKLGDHVTKDMSIFFADIRSFTTISESMSPEDNFNFINSLLNKFGPIVRQNNGFIDKFIGDAIMALFSGSPKDAINTAGQVLQELDKFNNTRAEQGSLPIRLGIGINYGTLMLGTIGEQQRMDGTVISDSVNLASRLEGLTKIFSANIIVSERVLNAVKDDMDLDYRFLGEVNVKGKNKTVSIYDIFSFDSSEIKAIKHEIKDMFESALLLFESNSFEASKQLFLNVKKKFPEDLATEYYLARIETDSKK